MQSYVTERILEPFEFRWTITKFSSFPLWDSQYSLTSGQYITSRGIWRLILFPRGCDDFLSVYLYLIPTRRSDIQAINHCNFVIKSSTNKDFKRTVYYQIMTPQSPTWGFPRFIPTRALLMRKDLLLLDNLTLHVHGQLDTGLEIHKEPEVTITVGHSLSSDMKSLLQSGSGSDVTLIAEGKEFPCHKVILGARSPVFAAMFGHNMLEQISGRADLKDIRARVLQELLEFIYMGKELDDRMSTTLLMDLLEAADKYEVIQLKDLCERRLFSRLNNKNILDLLVHADVHQCHQLKKACLKLYVSRIKQLSNNSTWKKDIEELPKQVLVDIVMTTLKNT